MTFLLSPDGERYLQMGGGIAQPMPFHLRPGLPAICRMSRGRWVAANLIGMAFAAWLVGCLAMLHGATGNQAAFATALFLGLPWVRFCFSRPVLVDMPGLALTLLAAVSWMEGYLVLPLVAVVAGALISEKVPIWAAIFAWSPLLLVGLAIPLARRLLFKPAAVNENDRLSDTLTHPLRSGLESHRHFWRDPRVMLLPWGACLVAVIHPMGWWMAAALAAGYAQLLVATDTVRLYQQAAPVVCVATALAVPLEWMPAVLVAHWFNPWAGEGV